MAFKVLSYTIEFLLFCAVSPFQYCILLYYIHNALIVYILTLATCVCRFILLFLILSVAVLLMHINVVDFLQYKLYRYAPLNDGNTF